MAGGIPNFNAITHEEAPMSNRIKAPRAKITYIGIMALFFIIGFSYIAFAGGAYSPDEIFGKWRGFVDPQDIRVDLEVRSDRASLHYGPDRSCRASAEYVRLKAGTHIYRFKVKHGESLQGWCKNLRDEKMELTRQENGTLDLHIVVENKGIDETVNLAKEG
jgi:hypothetical protein